MAGWEHLFPQWEMANPASLPYQGYYFNLNKNVSWDPVSLHHIKICLEEEEDGRERRRDACDS